jgi:hypothetical protein
VLTPRLAIQVVVVDTAVSQSFGAGLPLTNVDKQ